MSTSYGQRSLFTFSETFSTFLLLCLRFKAFFFFQAVIEECQAILDGIDGVTSVHSRFYELTSNYHKLLGNHAEYYKEALRFLGCVSLKDIPCELLFSYYKLQD